MKIDSTNFHKSTNGRWIPCEMPESAADFISFTPYGEVSSAYWHTESGVIRVSDHWGGVASCQWNLHTVSGYGFDKCRKTELRAGMITYAELEKNKNLSIRLLQIASAGEIDSQEADEIRNQLKTSF